LPVFEIKMKGILTKRRHEMKTLAEKRVDIYRIICGEYVVITEYIFKIFKEYIIDNNCAGLDEKSLVSGILITH
jgi:hypothetical protein